MIIVLNVIFMARRRNKDRIEIDGVNPQVLQVVQLIDHPLQVPSIEFSKIRKRVRHAVPVVHPSHMSPAIGVFITQYVTGGISVAETVHQDLIHHGALRPIRGRQPGCQEKTSLRMILSFFEKQAAPVISPDGAVMKLNAKRISDPFRSKPDGGMIEVKTSKGPLKAHGVLFFLIYEHRTCNLVALRA